MPTAGRGIGHDVVTAALGQLNERGAIGDPCFADVDRGLDQYLGRDLDRFLHRGTVGGGRCRIGEGSFDVGAADLGEAIELRLPPFAFPILASADQCQIHLGGIRIEPERANEPVLLTGLQGANPVFLAAIRLPIERDQEPGRDRERQCACQADADQGVELALARRGQGRGSHCCAPPHQAGRRRLQHPERGEQAIGSNADQAREDAAHERVRTSDRDHESGDDDRRSHVEVGMRFAPDQRERHQRHPNHGVEPHPHGPVARRVLAIEPMDVARATEAPSRSRHRRRSHQQPPCDGQSVDAASGGPACGDIAPDVDRPDRDRQRPGDGQRSRSDPQPQPRARPDQRGSVVVGELLRDRRPTGRDRSSIQRPLVDRAMRLGRRRPRRQLRSFCGRHPVRGSVGGVGLAHRHARPWAAASGRSLCRRFLDVPILVLPVASLPAPRVEFESNSRTC